MTTNQPTSTHSPDLIRQLLEHEIKVNKLIYGLYNMRIVAHPYLSNLGGTILSMIGFTEKQRTQVLNKVYDSFMIALVNTDIFEEPFIIKELALELYEILLKEKALRNGLDNLN